MTWILSIFVILFVLYAWIILGRKIGRGDTSEGMLKVILIGLILFVLFLFICTVNELVNYFLK